MKHTLDIGIHLNGRSIGSITTLAIAVVGRSPVSTGFSVADKVRDMQWEFDDEQSARSSASAIWNRFAADIVYVRVS